ncbi:hypothetical protein ACNF49_30590 [Actinomadura sp. ATCC 39365]
MLVVFSKRSISIVVASLAVVYSVAACGHASLDKKSCRQEALRQIGELKQAVHGLLPASVASTQEEEDACDSAEGGSLHYMADQAMSREEILKGFIAKGWKRIDTRDKNACPDCIDGMTTRWKGKVVDVTFVERQDRSGLSISVDFRSD